MYFTMTGTLNRCSPCVAYSFPGFAGSISGYGMPVAPPGNTAMNWQYTDLNCGRLWYWIVGRQAWTQQYTT